MDSELTRLQRAAAASGDVADVARLLAARVRAGALNPYHIRQAAALGDPASLLIAQPAEPTDRQHCNYGAAQRGNEMAIAFNPVDGVLGWIFDIPTLVTITSAFIKHGLVEDYSTFMLNKRLLDLGAQWCDVYQKQNTHIDELYSFWKTESREEFYEKYRVREISEEYAQELAMIEGGIRDFSNLLSTLILDDESSVSHIRWAVVYVAKMMLDRHGANLSAIWVAVHCRLAAGDATEIYQRQELAWESRFLINWLLA